MTPRDEYGDPVTIHDVTDDPGEIADHYAQQRGGRGFRTPIRRQVRDEEGWVRDVDGTWRWEPIDYSGGAA